MKFEFCVSKTTISVPKIYKSKSFNGATDYACSCVQKFPHKISGNIIINSFIEI